MTKGVRSFSKTGMLLSLLVTLLVPTACGSNGNIAGKSGASEVVKEDPVE